MCIWNRYSHVKIVCHRRFHPNALLNARNAPLGALTFDSFGTSEQSEQVVPGAYTSYAIQYLGIIINQSASSIRVNKPV